MSSCDCFSASSLSIFDTTIASLSRFYRRTNQLSLIFFEILYPVCMDPIWRRQLLKGLLWKVYWKQWSYKNNLLILFSVNFLRAWCRGWLSEVFSRMLLGYIYFSWVNMNRKLLREIAINLFRKLIKPYLLSTLSKQCLYVFICFKNSVLLPFTIIILIKVLVRDRKITEPA